MRLLALAASAFALTSPAFKQGGTIPRVYTCDGRNVSPPLVWPAPPRRTRSFALTVTDPDAPGGTFAHWVGWNISPRARGLREAQVPPVEGVNDAGRRGYLGPCPPSGRHRYVFTLYALDAGLPVPPGSPREALEAAIKGHVLARAVLVGTYAR